jgi:hypothetical protein
MTKEPFVIGYPTLTPKYVSLQAPAYGWLHFPLVEPDLTNANASFWR